MKLNIKTTTISLTPAISDYVEKRIQVIEKFLEDDPTVQCDLELAKTSNHHRQGDIFKAEIHIIGKNKNLYASSEKEDLYVAIDAVKDDILREIKNSKEKRQSVLRRGGARVKNIIKGFWKQ